MTTRTAPLEPGYWKPGAEYDTPKLCPEPEFCIGGSLEPANATSISICAVGHDPAIPYCSIWCVERCASMEVPALNSGGSLLTTLCSLHPPLCSLDGYYMSIQSGCLKCAASIPVETFIVFPLLLVLAIILLLMLRRTNGVDRANLKTVLKILFVTLNILTPIPATFGIEFVSRCDATALRR